MPIPTSVREAILNAAFAALDSSIDKPGPIFRTRADALQTQELPAFLMYPLQDEAQRVTADTVERVLTLRFEAMTAGAPPQDQALDPLLTFVTMTLLADATFKSLIQGFVDSKILWEFKDGEQDYALGALDVKITYVVAQADPSIQKTGYQGVVSASMDGGATWHVVGDLANVEFDLTMGSAEVTNAESQGEEFVATMPGWKATAKQLYVRGDLAQAFLLDAALLGDMLKFEFDPAGEGTGNDRLTGAGFFVDCKFSQAQNQPMWKNLQIQGTGPLVRSAQ
jgi:hypothetical protein